MHEKYMIKTFEILSNYTLKMIRQISEVKYGSCTCEMIN